MTRNIEEALQVLRYQLNFLEQGGLARLVQEKPRPSPFRDSMSCLNYGDPLRPHACRECILYDFVPEGARTEDVPCHHIPLDDHDRTIASSINEGNLSDLDSVLKDWVKRTIARLEDEAKQIDCCAGP